MFVWKWWLHTTTTAPGPWGRTSHEVLSWCWTMKWVHSLYSVWFSVPGTDMTQHLLFNSLTNLLLHLFCRSFLCLSLCSSSLLLLHVAGVPLGLCYKAWKSSRDRAFSNGFLMGLSTATLERTDSGRGRATICQARCHASCGTPLSHSHSHL